MSNKISKLLLGEELSSTYPRIRTSNRNLSKVRRVRQCPLASWRLQPSGKGNVTCTAVRKLPWPRALSSQTFTGPGHLGWPTESEGPEPSPERQHSAGEAGGRPRSAQLLWDADLAAQVAPQSKLMFCTFARGEEYTSHKTSKCFSPPGCAPFYLQGVRCRPSDF